MISAQEVIETSPQCTLRIAIDWLGTHSYFINEERVFKRWVFKEVHAAFQHNGMNYEIEMKATASANTKIDGTIIVNGNAFPAKIFRDLEKQLEARRYRIKSPLANSSSIARIVLRVVLWFVIFAVFLLVSLTLTRCAA